MKKNKTNYKPVKVTGHVVDADLSSFCMEMMIPFIQNNNVARMIAESRDGLKVVERRILYTLYAMLGVRVKEKDPFGYGKLYKVSKIMGDTLGEFHPHGDGSIEQSVTSMAQWWKAYPTLIYGDGNFGNVYGEDAAAPRYIKASMSKFAYEVYFASWESNTIDFRNSYTNENKEPEVLHADLPMVLIRGTFGLGTGLMSCVPMYNLREVVQLTKKLIRNPNLKEVWLVPDYILPCEIINTDFKKMCETGEGVLSMRAIIKESGDDLVITSFPYKFRLSKLNEKLKSIKEDIKNNKNKKKNKKQLSIINDIKDIKNNSTGDDFDNVDLNIRVVLEKGANKAKVKDFLYKVCGLKIDLAVNFELVEDYETVHFNLRSYLNTWINYARENKRRYYINIIKSKTKEYHMLQTIIDIISKPSSDKIISKIMRKSKDRKEISKKLQKEFNISDLQADVISEFKYYKLSISSLNDYKEKAKECKKKIKEITDIIDNPDSIDEKIIERLDYFSKTYGVDRNSVIVEPEVDGVTQQNVSVAITKNGAIKMTSDKASDSLYNVTNDSNDEIIYLKENISNFTKLNVFTNTGKVYGLKLSDVMQSNKKEMGYMLSDFINCSDNEKVVQVLIAPKKKNEILQRVIFLTKNGLIKSSKHGNWTKVNKSGTTSIILNEDDELTSVTLIHDNSNDLLIYTERGHGLRIPNDLTTTLKTSMGVIGIKLNKNDKALGCIEMYGGIETVCIITNKSIKRIYANDIEVKKRASSGIKIIGLLKDETIKYISEDEDNVIDCILYKLGNPETDTLLIDTNEYPISTKIAKGTKLKLNKKNILIK